jgi:hypothetical protein
LKVQTGSVDARILAERRSIGSVHSEDTVIRIVGKHILTTLRVVLGGVVVIALATGPKVRTFKPGRVQLTFKSD